MMEENKEEKKLNEEKNNEAIVKKENNETSKKEEISKKEPTKKDNAPKKEVDNKQTVKEEDKKDDLTFKKAEMTEKNKKKLSEMDKKEKKSHKLAKAILIIFMILIAAYCVFFVRNLIILNNIAKVSEKLRNSNNFTYTSVNNENNGSYTMTIDYYKKDNVERMDLSRTNSNADASIIIWYDNITDEKILAALPSRQADIKIVADAETVHLPLEENLYNGGTRAFLSLISWIYSEEYNGKECYVIQNTENEKTWIDKETGLVLKRELQDNTVEYKNIIIDNLTEVYKPDLTGYQIKDESNAEN